MTAELKKFEGKDQMTVALADAIILRLQAAITERGQASLIVSGGSTPKILFAELATRELAWDKVIISLADERWVDPSSSDSNENLVYSSFLVGKAAQATFVSLKSAHENAEEGAIEINAALAAIPSPYDIVLLGMGEDGHTASLFPYAETLASALDMNSGLHCQALVPKELPAHAPYARITMTLPRLLNSRWLVLLLAGQSKLDVYEQALADSDVNAMPVRAVLQQTQTPITTYWAA